MTKLAPMPIVEQTARRRPMYLSSMVGCVMVLAQRCSYSRGGDGPRTNCVVFRLRFVMSGRRY
jgi:hypothetical protein